MAADDPPAPHPNLLPASGEKGRWSRTRNRNGLPSLKTRGVLRKARLFRHALRGSRPSASGATTIVSRRQLFLATCGQVAKALRVLDTQIRTSTSSPRAQVTAMLSGRRLALASMNACRICSGGGLRQTRERPEARAGSRSRREPDARRRNNRRRRGRCRSRACGTRRSPARRWGRGRSPRRAQRAKAPASGSQSAGSGPKRLSGQRP